MTTIISLLLAFWFAGAGITPPDPLPTAAEQDVFAMIERSFGDGDAPALRSLMADYTEIRLPDNSGLYSRAQTGYVLRAFFRSYPPERFVLKRRFSGPSGWYASGHYWHTRGSAALTVSIQLEERGNRTVIRSLVVEGKS